MGKLINIDNGGTLTDICVIDGAKVWRTKTLTTPLDLSRCLLDGLKKVSGLVFGEEDVERLLLATDHVRYSTTQGTNALIQRKGPRLGLLHSPGIAPAELRAGNSELFDALLADRVAVLATQGETARYDAVRAVADLAARGANRIVIAFSGDTRDADERQLKRALLRAFPAHLLGAVPLLYSHEIAGDDNDIRRTWTALFNAFLHPAMERFLYSAEHRLRAARAQRPLLIFRNDGQSSRVAKTIAIKTYSSGPRGGAEGARKLASHYGYKRLLSLDIGGTTTDISLVENDVPRAHERGVIAGVETSFPLMDVSSVGVGGSSIFRVVEGVIKVGPDSVGSEPGPACFALGGTDATITDAFFAAGLLDPASYFGGAMQIDVERAKNAVMTKVAKPLGLGIDAAIDVMEAAWVKAVAQGVTRYAKVDSQTVLAAFGGAGPFVICQVAAALQMQTVLIPKLAAVFSAFGIGFSDIGHRHEAPLHSTDAAEVAGARAKLSEQARRGMVAEGIDLAACVETVQLVVSNDSGEQLFAPESVPAVTGKLSLRLSIACVLPHPELTGQFSTSTPIAAVPSGSRALLMDGQRKHVPLYKAVDLVAGAGAAGPAVLEEEFFTCRIDPGWRFTTNSAGDILITRSGS